MDNSKKEGGIVQLVVVLGLITFICALLLGVINGVTADKITQNGIETRNAQWRDHPGTLISRISTPHCPLRTLQPLA